MCRWTLREDIFVCASILGRGTPDRSNLSDYLNLWSSESCETSIIMLLNLSSCAIALNSAQLFSQALYFSSVWRKESCRYSKSLFSPPPPPQHHWWLEGVAHFPESKVSQLTKNVSVLLHMRSPLTVLRNFFSSQRVVRYAGSRELVKGEVEQRLGPCRDPSAQLELLNSLNGIMLKSHALCIAPPVYESWQHFGGIFQGKVWHAFDIKTDRGSYRLSLITGVKCLVILVAHSLYSYTCTS